MHHATVSLVAFQKSNRVGAPPFPRRKPSQNGPRRQGFAAPRRNRAPLTAPGRSEEPFLNMRERRIGKLMTLASKHLAVSRPRTRTPKPRGPAQWLGAGCRNFSRLPARGGAFSLDILFNRTKRAPFGGETEKLPLEKATASRSRLVSVRCCHAREATSRQYGPFRRQNRCSANQKCRENFEVSDIWLLTHGRVRGVSPETPFISYSFATFSEFLQKPL